MHRNIHKTLFRHASLTRGVLTSYTKPSSDRRIKAEILQFQPFLVFNSSIEFARCISSEYVLFCILSKCHPVKFLTETLKCSFVKVYEECIIKNTNPIRSVIFLLLVLMKLFQFLLSNSLFPFEKVVIVCIGSHKFQHK